MSGPDWGPTDTMREANPTSGWQDKYYPPPPSATEKPSNPKDLIGSDKLPLSMVPATSIAYQSLGHLEGTLKYGLVNWREAGVRASIYIDALGRHQAKWLNGEWEDPKTGVPHLGSMLACIGIIVDAYECGKLIDDRPKQAPVAALIDRFAAKVKHLREMFKDKHPHHYVHEPQPDTEGRCEPPSLLECRWGDNSGIGHCGLPAYHDGPHNVTDW